MKTLAKVVGVVVAGAILVLLVLRFTGLDPNQRRAGVWLRGSASSFPTDWSFADKYPTLMVETHPWYLVAHSVNIYFVTALRYALRDVSQEVSAKPLRQLQA